MNLKKVMFCKKFITVFSNEIATFFFDVVTIETPPPPLKKNATNKGFLVNEIATDVQNDFRAAVFCVLFLRGGVGVFDLTKCRNLIVTDGINWVRSAVHDCYQYHFLSNWHCVCLKICSKIVKLFVLLAQDSKDSQDWHKLQDEWNTVARPFSRMSA